jgi:hypothetical protein
LGPADRSRRDDTLRLDPRPGRLCLAFATARWRIANADRDGDVDPNLHTYRDRHIYSHGDCHRDSYSHGHCDS